MFRVPAFLAPLFCPLFSTAAACADAGAIVMHGKWGVPERVSAIANALERAGVLVVSPEMPWPRRRAYDRPVEETDRLRPHWALPRLPEDFRAGSCARRIFSSAGC